MHTIILARKRKVHCMYAYDLEEALLAKETLTKLLLTLENDTTIVGLHFTSCITI